MIRLSCVLLSLILVLSMTISAMAAPESEAQLSSNEIVSIYYDEEIVSLFDFEQVHSNVWYFANVLGPRLWGTPSETQLAYHVADLFEEYGFEDVDVAELPRGNTSYQPELIIHDYNEPTAVEYGYPTTFDKGIPVARGSTNNENTQTGPDGVTGTVVYAGEGLTAADFPAETEGNIVLIERYTKTADEIGASYALAVAAGAEVVLFVAPEPAPRIGGVSTGWPTAGSSGTAPWSTVTIANATTPYAFVPDFAAEYMLEEPDTVVTYRMQGYDTYHNVVATIPGPSEDSDIVIFLSHLDTVTASSGANDNGTGVATVLELARVYKILADQGKLDKEVVFVTAGAEETGLVGSNAIANAREGSGFTTERVNRIIACYNFDMVAPGDPNFPLTQSPSSPEPSADPGLTLTLRQHYGNTNPPIDDIVSINSLAAAERYGLPIIDIDKLNDTGEYGIKLTNGGGSDHAPFGNLGIPNANHTFRGSINYPATAPAPSTYWSNSVPLEASYHTANDIFYANYSPEKMEIALWIAAASSYAIARADEMTLTSDKRLVMNGNDFNLSASFTQQKNSNAAVLNLQYDTSLFTYTGYTESDGITLLNTETTEDGVKLTLMISGYDAQNLGEMHMSVNENAELENEVHAINLIVDYVELDEETGEKTVVTAAAGTTIRTFAEREVDLILLSDLIDVFGITSDDPEWEYWQFYDFNNSGDIDIFDISYIAMFIK